MRVLAALAVVLFLVPSAVEAQRIPGSDDPAMRAAAVAWLNGDDPEQALWALGDMAAGGNVAARLLAVHIYHRFVPMDFPGLTRQERRALFPPDRIAGRSFAPYLVDRYSLPAFEALAGMSAVTTPEEWIARAKVLLSAGLRDRFLEQFSVANFTSPFSVEVLQFAETVVREDDYEYAYILFFHAFEPAFLDYLDATDPARAEARRARWRKPPWSPEWEATFEKALREGRWSAIRAVGLLAPFNATVLDNIPRIEVYRRWGAEPDVSPTGDEAERTRLDEADLGELGGLLIEDAARSVYLRPLLGACRAHCPNEVAACMAMGARYGFYVIASRPGLEPVISREEFFDTERAARELVAIAGGAARDIGPAFIAAMPACFQDAARRQADAANPEQ